MFANCSNFTLPALALSVWLTALASFASPTNAPGALKLSPSPIQTFREVLVMTPAEREEFFHIRPPGLREPLEAKINEYLEMSAEERELRLQATELRFYLLQLLPQPRTNQIALLSQIAEPMRTLVGARLDTAQLFPDPMRSELFANEQALRVFTQFEGLTELQRRQQLEQMPAEQRRAVEADIDRWRNLPATTRERLTAQLNQFFDLNTEERQRSLAHLSEPERTAMEKTLAAFRELPPAKREQCLRSFARFTSMSLADRQLFLKKAEAWQKMSPAERQQWRELVQQMPATPPYPDGFVPPPLPGEETTLATNHGKPAHKATH